MNNRDNDPSAVAERLFNALSVYMDQVDLAEFIAKNPTMQEIADKLAELKQNVPAMKSSNPYGFPTCKNRWVTDKLVITKHGSYKDYREVK